MQINITVRNQSIIDICPCVVLAEDSQNYVTAVFTFLTDDWENAEKTAQFQNPKTGEVYESILDSSNACTIRWEALADSGDMNVAVFGANGGYRVTTNMGVITVLPTLSGGESDTPPSPDVYQQLLTMLGQKADNMTYSDNVLRLLSGSKELASVIIAGGGSSAQPDWNQNDSGAADYIKNRPFYDDTNVLLEWDGNTEGLVAAVTVDEVEGFPAGTAVAYKIAEYMDPELFVGATLMISDGSSLVITEEEIKQTEGITFVGALLLTDKAVVAQNVNFPEAGTYTSAVSDAYVSKIYTGGIVKLPNKYLNLDTGIQTLNLGAASDVDIRKLEESIYRVITDSGEINLNGLNGSVAGSGTSVTVATYSTNCLYLAVSREESSSGITIVVNVLDQAMPTQIVCEANGTDNYASWASTKTDIKDICLSKDNTAEYTPTGDYNPATKKYVDDAVSGVSAATPRQQMQSTDTTVTLQPNTLYVFPEMATLAVTLAAPTNTAVANEYHFFFTSGVTATTMTLPEDVVTAGQVIEANKKYEVSILENIAYIQGVSISGT